MGTEPGEQLLPHLRPPCQLSRYLLCPGPEPPVPVLPAEPAERVPGAQVRPAAGLVSSVPRRGAAEDPALPALPGNVLSNLNLELPSTLPPSECRPEMKGVRPAAGGVCLDGFRRRWRRRGLGPRSRATRPPIPVLWCRASSQRSCPSALGTAETQAFQGGGGVLKRQSPSLYPSVPVGMCECGLPSDMVASHCPASHGAPGPHQSMDGPRRSPQRHQAELLAHMEEPGMGTWGRGCCK